MNPEKFSGAEAKNEKEKIESTRQEVGEMIEGLGDEGYELKFREEGNEFIVGLNDNRELHFPVWETIPVLEKKEDKPLFYPTQEVIRASIVGSGENLVETINQLREKDAEKKTRLESIREELRDFQKKEETHEIQSSHLIETPGNPRVNLNALTKEDFKMYGRLNNFTFEEFDEYRRNIPQGDENRRQFAAFLANLATPRLGRESWKKEKDK